MFEGRFKRSERKKKYVHCMSQISQLGQENIV